ncbi:MAG: hypothetical protein JW759_04635 [Candidatus Coatesbacteria bacterium]|nr:hypothetical protein [Candidatus Coatesbacteria bacterium]
MKPTKCLPFVLLAILLCLTISCTTPVNPGEDETGASPAAPSRRGMTSQGPIGTTLTGPCEKVFLEHPKQMLTVTEGQAMFYYPADAETGEFVQSGFQTTVGQNIAYKFVVAEGYTLTFTAVDQP